jgi:hypothetical protein
MYGPTFAPVERFPHLLAGSRYSIALLEFIRLHAAAQGAYTTQKSEALCQSQHQGLRKQAEAHDGAAKSGLDTSRRRPGDQEPLLPIACPAFASNPVCV